MLLASAVDRYGSSEEERELDNHFPEVSQCPENESNRLQEIKEFGLCKAKPGIYSISVKDVPSIKFWTFPSAATGTTETKLADRCRPNAGTSPVHGLSAALQHAISSWHWLSVFPSASMPLVALCAKDLLDFLVRLCKTSEP
jgi:hypothetical protein